MKRMQQSHQALTHRPVTLAVVGAGAAGLFAAAAAALAQHSGGNEGS